MPNQEVMREWVARLRSGRYVQGQGKLHTTDRTNVTRHCCLGVLSDMAVERGIIEPPVARREFVTHTDGGHIRGDFETVYIYDDNTTMPPREVLAWADIPCASWEFSDRPSGAPLCDNQIAHLNDSGYGFDQIADLIEEEWVELPEGTEIPDSVAALTETTDV